ncbi:MAG: hypothetical protein DRP75_03500, partial [Candidatus Omnitrophota bacterium]
VYNPKTSTFQRKLVEQIFTPEDIESRLREQVLLHFPEDRRLRLAVTELIRKSISPNLFFDKKETERRKQEAWNSVPEVRREVKKNQIIVARGQKITRKHLSQLAEIAKRRKKEQFLPVFIGLTLLISVFVGLSQRYIRDFSFPYLSVFCILSSFSCFSGFSSDYQRDCAFLLSSFIYPFEFCLYACFYPSQRSCGYLYQYAFSLSFCPY